MYIGPFRNILNVGSQTQYYDLRIGDAFIGDWNFAISGENRKLTNLALEVVKELEAIFQLDRLELIPAPNNSALKAHVNRHSFNINEHGAGMSQFLAVLYAVKVKRPTYLLIDEPEANLHPSLQLRFLTVLGAQSQLGVLYATHSLGLARAAAQRVYSVHKSAFLGPAHITDFHELRNPTEFVGELSFSGNYDLGYRSILLVEGPTDLTVFIEFLQKLGISHLVTTIHLGGSSTISRKGATQLAELRRLSDNVFAIIDSERTSSSTTPSDRNAFAKGCGRLGIQCTVLSKRSIECYFPESAVRHALGESFHALKEFEPVPDAWPKSLNWKIAQAMSLESLRDSDLGTALDEIRLKSIKPYEA